MDSAADLQTEEAQLYAWRLRELERLGYSTSDAAEMALTPTIGLHELADLLRAGCAHDLARSILS